PRALHRLEGDPCARRPLPRSVHSEQRRHPLRDVGTNAPAAAEGGVPMQALEGLRVLELGEMVAAAYGAKLMADLGADVIKVEPPGGDPARSRGPFPAGKQDREASGLFLYLNTNKRGVTVDTARDPRELERLVAWADILIHNFPPRRMAERGIDYERFRALNP